MSWDYNLPCFCKNDDVSGKMKIEGYGEIDLKPDTAYINFSIITDDKNLKSAQKKNSETTAKVIRALEKHGIEKQNIVTISYNVEQQYDYLEGMQVFKAYRITNTLRVKTTELNRIGEIIDVGINAGANRVFNIKFQASNAQCYYNNALILAVENSILKAQQVGEALKVCLCKVPYKIEEGTYFTSELEGNVMVKSELTTTPIIPGEIKISSRVQAYFSYN